MLARNWLFLTVLCAAASPVGAGDADGLARIAARMGVPCVRVPRLAQPPPLERAPDFSKWAGPLAFRFLSGSSGAPPLRTEGFLACDAERLYAAVRCHEPNMPATATQPVPPDGNVWASDSVEFFFLPQLDSAGAYYQFAVSPAGSLYDAKANQTAWNSAAAVRVWRDEASWTVVLSVPLRSLGIEPGNASPLWRMNLHRLRPRRGGVGELDVAWSPTRSRSNHVPDRFGLVLLEGMGRFDPAGANAFLDRAEKLQIVFRQTFESNTLPFSAGEIVRGEGPGGAKQFLRAVGKRGITLERNFGDIRELHMACAYRTPPNQVGLVIHGNGTIVRACRPGKVEVLGRGLKVARATARDADGQSRAFDLGLDAYRFLRPYGH